MAMSARLTIGDFARVTHLSVKTLRHYHEVGLLEPDEVDAATSYRHYTPAQIPRAQVIRRLRDLDMPVPEVKAVLATTDVTARNAVIARHLERLERELAATRTAVDSLRAILGHTAENYPVSHRTVPATRAIAVQAVVEREHVVAWWHGALGELHATARAQQLAVTGPLFGLYDGALFADGRGAGSVCLPIGRTAAVTEVGRIEVITVPAAELAIVTHTGSHDNVDVAYGELGAHVAAHEIGVDGPMREYYLRDPSDHRDPATWLTEIAWPIFRAG